MRRLALLFALCLPSALVACSDGNTAVDAPPQPTGTPTGAPSASATASAKPASTSTYPATAKRPVVNEYHGVKVTDDYQWLENGEGADVKPWTVEQN